MKKISFILMLILTMSASAKNNNFLNEKTSTEPVSCGVAYVFVQRVYSFIESPVVRTISYYDYELNFTKEIFLQYTKAPKLLEDLTIELDNPENIKNGMKKIEYYYSSKNTKVITRILNALKYTKNVIVDHPGFDKIINYGKNRLEKLGQKYEEELDDVAINNVHKANLNKILFTSDKNINPLTAPASAYKTSFSAGEEIFAVAMLNKAINQDLVNKTKPTVLFRKDDWSLRSEIRIEHQMFKVTDNQLYFIFPIVVKPSNVKCSGNITGTDQLMMKMSDFGPMDHDIVILLKDAEMLHDGSENVEGTFTIDASIGDVETIREWAIGIKDKCNRE